MGPDEVEKAVRVDCAHTAWGGGAGSQGPAPTLLFGPGHSDGAGSLSPDHVTELGYG